MPRKLGGAAAKAHGERMAALRANYKLPLGDPVPPPGPGRPAGAGNWVDGQIAKYLDAMGFVHPVIGWADINSRSIPDLAKILGIKIEAAAAIHFRAGENVAKYAAEAMPQALRLSGDGAVQLVLEVGGSAPIGADQPGLPVVIEGDVVDPGKSEG